jgi:hypothetical protein
MSPAGTLSGSRSFKDTRGGAVAGQLFLFRRAGRRLPNSVSQRQKVIRAWLRWMGGHCQPQYFPAARNGQRSGVLFAKIVTMRLSVSGQRTQDSR